MPHKRVTSGGSWSSPCTQGRGDSGRGGTTGTTGGHRPLFAANHALPEPDEPLELLWHAATLLREHRGDGHVAVLTANGINGREAHVLHALATSTQSGTVPLEQIERAVLQHLHPPLNIAGVQHANRSSLQAARKIMADRARAWRAPSDSVPD